MQISVHDSFQKEHNIKTYEDYSIVLANNNDL